MIDSDLSIHPGSFRDPSGYVYTSGNRVFRTVTESARNKYEFIRDNIVVSKLQDQGRIIKAREIDCSEWPSNIQNVAYLLEHPRIPFISYPYEWSFEQLREAALHHLELQMDLLDFGITLSDATAYNIQFVGPKPIFIDFLSLRPYVEGEFWWSHRQFCEQFLNPLLLRAVVGVAHNSWFRGSLEGITTADLAKLVPQHRRFSLNIFTQVILQAKLERDAIATPLRAIDRAKKAKRLPKGSYRAILQQLRNWIGKLAIADESKTIWEDYANNNTYSDVEARAKRSFITEFVKSVRPHTIIDLGCNTGDYSLAALEAGAQYAIGIDSDHKAIGQAYKRSKAKMASFLPLCLDAANPSPSQGWQQNERQGFAERARVDALIALAFEHHLAIGKNMPFSRLVPWLIKIAPQAIIEFVPKNDSTIRNMLALREDIFSDYTEEAFLKEIHKYADVVRQESISSSGRKLIWVKRR